MAKIKNWKIIISQANLIIWENSSFQKQLQLSKGVVSGWQLSKLEIGKGFATEIDRFLDKESAISFAKIWMEKHPTG